MIKNSFLYGTFLLIIVNFIVRLFGFSYKVILSRMIGSEGIGLFHLVYPILMTLITFTSAGIPIAVSKLVAHDLSLKNVRGCKKILVVSVISGLIISVILAILLLFTAKTISTSIIMNEDVYYSLLALTPAIPLITLSSIFRGYYYGMKKMGPPGISQVVEQVVRIIFVIGCLSIMLPLEPKNAVIIAVIGISVGEFSGLLWLLFKFKTMEKFHACKSYQIIKNGSRSILGKVFYISIPITITRMIGVIMQSIHAVLVPQRLELVGYTSQEALATFGKLTGMALPILFLPFIVTSALVVNIIPTVSEEMALENWKDISLKSSIALRITLLAAIPSMALFIFFADPLCSFIYKQSDVGQYLSFLAYSMVFLSVYHTASGILHGMGKQFITTINYFIGMILQIICTYYLVPDPRFGVNGFIIGFILSAVIICILNIVALNYYVRLRFNIFNSLIKPIFATILMVVIIPLVYTALINFDFSSSSSILFSILSGMLTYAAIVVLTGSINIKTLIFILKK